MTKRIAEILKNEGFIKGYKVEGEGAESNIIITLKYRGKDKVITDLKRISKPGLRVYAKVNEIPRVLNGLGIVILSTSQGLMTDKEARAKQVGGEVFTSELYNHLRQYSNAHIYNGYGPSEFTACCCNKEIIDGSNVSIGTPFCNTKIYILDDNHCLCPIGIPGEICVVGDGIAKGYLLSLIHI